MNSAIVECQGLVLRSLRYGETSRIVTLFTRELGKVGAMAKGARETRSPFGASLEPCCLGSYVLYYRVGRDLQFLKTGWTERDGSALWIDADRFLHASALLEFLDRILLDDEPAPLIFELSVRALEVLSQAPRARLHELFRAFQLRVAALLGYAPLLETCLHCARPLSDNATQEIWLFRPGEGGILCPNCASGADSGIRIRPRALRRLRTMVQGREASEQSEAGEVAILDRLCDELGLDTIETGGAIAVAMEAGKLSWGDHEGAIALLERVDHDNELSADVAEGVVHTGKKHGVARIPAVKGQGVPAWEPRTLKPTGITYCTSPMGADHTAGLIVMPVPDAARASQNAQIVNAVCDSSGFCQFQQPSMEEMRQYFNAMYGLSLSPQDIVQYGWQCLEDEWAFNRKAGQTDDQLPDWMTTEAIPTNGAVFDVPREEIERVYKLMPFEEDIMSARASG